MAITLQKLISMAVAGVCLVNLGCSTLKRPMPQQGVRIGCKNFPEQVLLAEIVARYLESKGVAVQRPFTRGESTVLHEEITHGVIDLYPEYSGTAAELLVPSESVSAVDRFDRLQKEYELLGLEWFPPLGYSNNFALVTRKDIAEPSPEESNVSQLAARHGWVIGVGQEFVYRPHGLQGLVDQYHIVLGQPIRTVASPADLYRLLGERRVDVVVGSSTDPFIPLLNLKVLNDDLGYFPDDAASLVVREDFLRQNPGLRETLKTLSGKLSLSEMRKMNEEMLSTPEGVVAAEFLARNKLIK